MDLNYDRAEEYEVSLTRDIMVKTRDGVKLAIDIYIPTKNGRAL